MAESTDIRVFEYFFAVPLTTLPQLFWLTSSNQFADMDCRHEFVGTRVARTWTSPCLCWPIPGVVPEGEARSLEKAFTTSELSDYGGIFISKRPQPSSNFSVIWKRTQSWMWANEVHMCSLHYIFLPRVNVQLNDFATGWISHGLSLPPTIEPLDSFGFGGCNRVQHPALLCRKKCLGVSHYSTIDFQLKCVSMKS